MWLISSDSPQLGGKRLWLRSGSGHLFGRTSGRSPNGERVQYIEHSSISRKHLIITVAANTPGDSGRIHTKPAITITEGSKFGTHINGETVKGESKTLDGNKFNIRLGTSDIVFKLEWCPVIFSFAGGVSKTAKANGTILAAEKAKLESMDIKLSTEYLSNQTTHVIAKKRNTPAGLQALLQARWLLAGSYVDAVATVGKRDGVDETGVPRPSPLELDYDSHWPHELDHMCPTAGEPVPRPNDWLKPNSQRAEVFDGYVFVFLDPAQLSLLMAVVTAGSGKALYYEGQSNSITAGDVVEYVKELAGKKEAENFVLSDEPVPGGIVLVRPSERAGGRYGNFLADIDIALDQRSIEQGEILDVILSNDARVLRTALRDPTQRTAGEIDGHSQNLAQTTSTSASGGASEARAVTVSDSLLAEEQRPSHPEQVPPTVQSEQEPQMQEQRRMEPPSATGTSRRRRAHAHKTFKGFDDFDESQILKAESQQRASSGPSQVRSAGNMDIDETQRNPRKRPGPDIDNQETHEQLFDRIMPGQAALKRQRMEALANGEKPFLDPTPAPVLEHITVVGQDGRGAKSKGKAERGDDTADLKAAMIAKREEEEKRYRDETEPFQIPINEDELEREPGKTEFFDLPVRPPPRQQQVNTRQSNPAWAGRPNYKKFVKKGGPPPAEVTHNGSKVFIVLEEVPSKSEGLGDDYWLEMGDANPRHNRRGKAQPISQTQSQSASIGLLPESSTGNTSQARGENDQDERTAFSRRLQRSREVDAEEDPASFEPVAGATQSTLANDSQRNARSKRPANAQLGGPAKKPRQAAVPSSRPTFVRIDGSDDDDPRAFRRKRR